MRNLFLLGESQTGANRSGVQQNVVVDEKRTRPTLSRLILPIQLDLSRDSPTRESSYEPFRETECRDGPIGRPG